MNEQMTQQERAAVLLDRIIGIIPIQPSQREARIEWLVEYAVETRRAALLECRDEINKLIGKDSGNWNRAIVYAADVANKLAQEGA